MVRVSRLAAAFAALLPLLAVWPALVNAANIPMYDGNTSRTRLIVDPSISPEQLYLSSPDYIHLPGQSVSTPTVVGNTLYQYTYSGSTGTLYAVNLPQVNAAQVLKRYGNSLPNYLTATAQYTAPPITFHTSEGAYGVSAQDSLSTSQGWQSIAVGHTLYAWPQGQWPASQSAINNRTQILGAPGNTRYQIDMNPLITPPLPVKIFNTQTGQNQTVQAPMAVACSWDGGCSAHPLGLPSVDTYKLLFYKTTQDFSGNSKAAITSDPVYIPSEPLFGGQPAAAFGVASWSHPRIELLDLITGRAKAIGAGEVGAAVADAVMLATPTGGQPMIVAHDEYGNVYVFALNGTLLQVIPSNGKQVELGEDGSLNNAPFGGALANVLQPVLTNNRVLSVPLPRKLKYDFNYPDFVGSSSPSTVYGASVNMPWCLGAQICRSVSAWSFSNLINPATGRTVSGSGIVLMSAVMAPAAVQSSSYVNTGELISSRTSPYVGVLLDAGPEQDIISWSNSTPLGGAIELFAPVNYGITAKTTASVPSGGTPTITAKPVPAGVTDNRLSWSPCRTGASPVTVDLTSSLGMSGYLSMTRTTAPTTSHPWSSWTASYKLPPNTTGKPVTWSGTAQAEDKFCQIASTSIQVVEQPGSQPPPPKKKKTLKPVPPTGTLNLIPNPALWGQTVKVTLTPKTPATPTLPPHQQLIPGWTWQIEPGTQLYWPKRPSTWAFAFPVAATTLQSESMTVSAGGHSARATFLENWWDGGCQTPQGICSQITSSIYTIYGQGPEYIPAHSWPVKAQYTVQITYRYHPWGQTGCVDTDAAKEASEVKTDKETSEPCTPTFGWLSKVDTGTIMLPATWATAILNTDGTALDSVGGG